MKNVDITIISDSKRIKSPYIFARKNFNLYKVLVKGKQFFHPKICIIDNKVCFVGSYNCTRESLENGEFVVKAKGEELIKGLNNYFEERKTEGICVISKGKILDDIVGKNVG